MACGSAAAAGEGWGSELKAAVPGRLEGQVVMIPVFTDGNLSLRLAALRFDFQPGGEPMFLPVVLTLLCESIMTSFTLNKIQGVLDVVWCLGLTNNLLKTNARNYEADLIIQIGLKRYTMFMCLL